MRAWFAIVIGAGCAGSDLPTPTTIAEAAHIDGPAIGLDSSLFWREIDAHGTSKLIHDFVVLDVVPTSTALPIVGVVPGDDGVVANVRWDFNDCGGMRFAPTEGAPRALETPYCHPVPYANIAGMVVLGAEGDRGGVIARLDLATNAIEELAASASFETLSGPVLRRTIVPWIGTPSTAITTLLERDGEIEIISFDDRDPRLWFTDGGVSPGGFAYDASGKLVHADNGAAFDTARLIVDTALVADLGHVRVTSMIRVDDAIWVSAVEGDSGVLFELRDGAVTGHAIPYQPLAMVAVDGALVIAAGGTPERLVRQPI